MGRAAPHQRGSRAPHARQHNKCAFRRSAHPSLGMGANRQRPTRAQKRAAGTKKTALFGIVNSRSAPLRGSHPNVSNRRRLPAAAWPRACRVPRRATRIGGAGGYPSTPAPCIFPVIYRCGSLDCTLRVRHQPSCTLAADVLHAACGRGSGWGHVGTDLFARARQGASRSRVPGERSETRDLGATRRIAAGNHIALRESSRWFPALVRSGQESPADTRAAQRGTVSARTLAASALRSSAQIAAISGSTS